jgi:hypothetical protein
MQHAQVSDGSEEAPMLSLVYTSTAVVPFSEVDLALLLAVSRSNNEPSAVTGVLLYRDGKFMQALEGPEAAVRRTLDRIAADPRHTDIRTQEEVRTAERRFGSWAMGYRSSDEVGDTASAWFGSPEALTPSAGSKTSELLTAFRD